MIRSYQASDLRAVAELFTQAVHGLACGDYDVNQLAAWAPRVPDLNQWAVRLAVLRTLVAEENTEPVGFISYERTGHIDLLYTSPKCARRGIASALFGEAAAKLCSEGIAELFTEASKTSRPFFESHGFRVIEEQHVELLGVAFQRYAMRKSVDRPEEVAAPAERSRSTY